MMELSKRTQLKLRLVGLIGGEQRQGKRTGWPGWLEWILL